MNGHFDDIMKDRLNKLDSEVPSHIFDAVQSRLDAMDESFDEAIRSGMTAHASPVPDDMWNRIQQRKDRRRPIAWWWAAALLLFGAGAWFYITQQEQPTPAPASRVAAAKDADSFQKQLAKPGPVPSPDPGAVAGIPPNTAAESITDITSQKKAASVAWDQPAVNEDNKIKRNQPVTKTAFGAKLKNTSPVPGEIPRSRGSMKMTLSASDIANRYEAASPANSDAVADPDLEAANIFADAGNLARLTRLSSLIRSSFRLNQLLPGQLLQANNRAPVIPCPVGDNEPRNDWYLDLYGGPSMVFKRLSATGTGKTTINGMDSTLHRQASLSMGVNLVKNFGENFLFKTGLLYSQVNEVFRNTRINEIKLITTVTIRTVILSPGDTIFVRDTSVIQQIGTVTKQTQNHYKSWDIPLILGYEFGGKDLRLNANVGIIANIHSGYSGEMLDTLQQTVNIATYKNTGVYKTNIGMSVYAGLAVLKAIGPRTDLLFEPHARFNLANTTNDPFWFRQKNITAGLSVGIRYKLNGSRQRP